ncbi:hypothetical protein IMZ38_01175 [Thermosphaera chiliense]|uniref:Uncharacterized protein n=1 Tax=Thermosphaera chiliense TaxID=3402707 RepID=A0A7M1UQQ8_9CREN|nr:hypothetical protein [Thermosphaera aggregans]QOR94580.1 hypothetical protein IMZ38_01175 [Thermosphaera aggregans]
MKNVPRGSTVKQSYNRAPATTYPVTVKTEHATNNSLSKIKPISSLVQVSSETEIPLPVDYADNLSAIIKEPKQTIYQKHLAKLTKNTGVKAKDAIFPLSLTIPRS